MGTSQDSITRHFPCIGDRTLAMVSYDVSFSMFSKPALLRAAAVGPEPVRSAYV